MDPTTEALLSGLPAPAAAPAAAPVVNPDATTIPVASPTVPISTPISSTPAPESGKHVAPDPGQAEVQPAPTATPAVPAPAPSGQASPAVSDDKLLAAAGLTESPDQELGRLRRDNSASGKEARRLLDFNKSLEDILKEQGADIATDEQGKPIGLIANKKYSKEMANLNIKADELSDDIQAQFETDPQKVIDFIVNKATKALTRVAPTLEKATASPLSSERHESAITYLADMKWETGDVKFPGLAANRKVIEQMLNAPSASKALKEFYNREPETTIALLNLQLDHARTHIAEESKKAVEALEAKKKAADTNPQPLPSGGGTPTLGGTPEGDLATQVAGTKLRY